MPVKRLSNGLLEIRSRHRLLRQTFQQNLSLVQKAGGAISTLKREMLDESFLQNRKLTVLCMAFDRADSLAVEVRRRDHTGRHGLARPVGIINYDRATQALRSAAAELGPGHPEILAQEIVHRQLVAHLARAVRASIDGDGQRSHLSTPLIMDCVTGKD